MSVFNVIKVLESWECCALLSTDYTPKLKSLATLARVNVLAFSSLFVIFVVGCICIHVAGECVSRYDVTMFITIKFNSLINVLNYCSHVWTIPLLYDVENKLLSYKFPSSHL